MIYEGEIDQKGKKHGYGILTLSNGTSYNGLWQGDTLTYGTRYDSTGIYVGHFSRALHPEGSGIYYSPKGERYSGEWKDGRRDGLGYAVAGDRLIRCGTWRENIFKGERMVYTADRVYGIDISRHQHEKGRKRFPLKWNDLRITSLGTARRVNGKVNYPVSFVYIKATEGRTVLNRYYLSDLREARRHGIAVGSYHFYSPTTSGEQQALWFLKKASIGTKDLPPVLDIEPTETQITRMGGEARLFTEVTAWLKTVTSRTGRKPILYVSQNFINNHLEKASPYIKGHEVWIARYSEFKPYVHLLHWQLTPHGRVNGITGEVDINVYNGTKEQFIEYLSRNGRQ